MKLVVSVLSIATLSFSSIAQDRPQVTKRKATQEEVHQINTRRLAKIMDGGEILQKRVLARKETAELADKLLNLHDAGQRLGLGKRFQTSIAITFPHLGTFEEYLGKKHSKKNIAKLKAKVATKKVDLEGLDTPALLAKRLLLDPTQVRFSYSDPELRPLLDSAFKILLTGEHLYEVIGHPSKMTIRLESVPSFGSLNEFPSSRSVSRNVETLTQIPEWYFIMGGIVQQIMDVIEPLERKPMKSVTSGQ